MSHDDNDDHPENLQAPSNVVILPTGDERVERLAKLTKWEYAQQRKAESKRLDVRASDLDEAVKEARRAKAPLVPTVASTTDLEASAKDIIASESVLDLFEVDWRKVVAGEVENAKILYLVATSRVFAKTMHAAIKGPSSGGKSEIRKQVLDFFPPESVISFTSLSEKALLYFEDEFSHKILSMGEAGGADEQTFQDYLLRELISEGVLKYPTVQKVGGELQTIVIEKHGPVSFMVTTTQLTLHAENETRMLSLEVDDSEDQTRAVLNKVAELEGLNASADAIDYGPWQDFQRWLEAGDHNVVVPYAKPLAAAIPPRAVRLRRDLGQVIRAIKGHALLHRNHRSRDERGAIVADIDHDYAVVRDLMHGLLQETAEVKIKDTILETIEAVSELTKDLPSTDDPKAKAVGTTAKAVGKVLKLDRSAAYRRLAAAEDGGFVVNLESRKGRPGKYRTTNESVEDKQMLSTPEELKVLFSPNPPKTTATVQPCDQVAVINGEIGCKADATMRATDKPFSDNALAGRLHGCTDSGGGESKEKYLEDDPQEREAIQDEPDLLEIPPFIDRRPSRMPQSST